MLEKFGIHNLKCMSNSYGSPRVSSEYPDCSLPLTFDFYNFCSFGCLYCFSLYQKIQNPSNKDNLMIKSINTNKFIEILEGKHPKNAYYKNFFKHRFPLHIGGLADNFCYIEEENRIGLPVIRKLAEMNYPTVISTKGVMMAEDDEYYEIFKKYADNKSFVFQFSIITNEDKVALRIEKGCPTVERRFAAMKKMSDLGYWTVLRLRPYIIGVSDINIENLFKRASEAGCRALSTEFFCVDYRIQGALSANFKELNAAAGYDMFDLYKATSPTERSGYLRMNRDIKERYVKQMFKLCKKYNIQFNVSDPDFKELNESGSCCGLPATKEIYNSDVVNYSRAQLTYHLIELRKRYYASNGKDKYLRFEDVVKDDNIGWLDETKYYSDSIKVWNADYTKKDMTFKKEFQDGWNNTRSAGSPMNYFHGILMPSHIENENIVYKYVPKPYEQKWRDEGLFDDTENTEKEKVSN